MTPKIKPQRKIPFAKRGPLKEILSELEKEDIIEEVQGPTEWISNLVLTPKSDGKLRMNIDMTAVNSAIKRTRHVIPPLEEDIFEPLFREDETMTDDGGEERMDREGNKGGTEVQSDTAETDADRTLGQADNETRFERPQRI